MAPYVSGSYSLNKTTVHVVSNVVMQSSQDQFFGKGWSGIRISAWRRNFVGWFYWWWFPRWNSSWRGHSITWFLPVKSRYSKGWRCADCCVAMTPFANLQHDGKAGCGYSLDNRRCYCYWYQNMKTWNARCNVVKQWKQYWCLTWCHVSPKTFVASLRHPQIFASVMLHQILKAIPSNS